MIYLVTSAHEMCVNRSKSHCLKRGLQAPHVVFAKYIK